MTGGEGIPRKYRFSCMVDIVTSLDLYLLIVVIPVGLYKTINVWEEFPTKQTSLELKIILAPPSPPPPTILGNFPCYLIILNFNTFKYHVFCTDGKISVRINLPLFSTVVPSNIYVSVL